MQKARNESIIRRLKTENRTLKEENRRLREMVRAEELHVSLTKEKKPSTAAEHFAAHGRGRALYQKSSFLRYLTALLRSSLFYGLWQRIYLYFRRYRLTVLILQILLVAISFLQTSAVFLLFSTLIAVLLPVLFLTLAILSQVAVYRKRGEKQKLRAAFNEKRKIFVFLLPKKTKSPSLSALFTSLASDGATVLAVSPHLFSSRGLFHKKAPRYYIAAREEAPHIFLLRGYFYFSIRKYLYTHCSDRLSVVY